MRATLGLLAVGVSAQVVFGKVDGLQGELTNVHQENVGLESYDRNLQIRGPGRPGGPPTTPVTPTRPVGPSRPVRPSRPTSTFRFSGVSLNIGRGSTVTIRCIVTITAPDGTTEQFEEEVVVGPSGTGDLEIPTDICTGCTTTVVAGACVAGECNGYDETETNNNLVANLAGDPHMTGLLGQKIDWAGEDGAWYCLFSDGPDFHVNVRLSAPLPVEFPDRQLVTAVSIITDNGLHSLLVEVEDPYSTVTEGCPASPAAPCLADGGLRILVDGQNSAALYSPAENVVLPGGEGSSEVVVSAANLPAECRPFGGDRIWATQFAQMMATRRLNMRIGTVSFAEWLLQPETLAAPTWCAQYLQEGGIAGLLATRSEHATFRVETPVAIVRINVGINYQDVEIAPDGATVIPELEFWQMDLGFDELHLSGDVTGLLGDTSRFALDGEGVPVTGGLSALHAPVESYRVADAYARDFEKLHGQ